MWTDKHPLDLAYSPMVAMGGSQVYVVCGWQGCTRRREIPREVWAVELARRAQQPLEPPLPLLVPIEGN